MRSWIVVATLVVLAVQPTNVLAQTGTWVSHGPEGGSIAALAIDPRSPSIVYAGTLGSGVFKSTDAGESWDAVGPPNAQVVALAIDAVTALSVREHPGHHHGHGHARLVQLISRLSAKIGNGRGKGHGNGHGQGAATIIYAGTLGMGVLKSTDGGDSWQASNAGITNVSVQSLAIDPSSPMVVYAGTTDGVFKSIDAGATWRLAGLQGAEIRALAIDPDNPATVYAGTSFGVFKSTNSGAVWAGASTGITMRDIRVLAIDRQTPLTLYVGSGGGAAGGGGAVFKTVNGGESWANTGLATPEVRALAVDPEHPRRVYVGSLSSNVFTSADGGDSWTAVDTGLRMGAVLSLSASAHRPRTVYAGTNGGVLKSDDRGASWEVKNTRLTNTFAFALAIDRTTPTTLYAGMNSPDIFKNHRRRRQLERQEQWPPGLLQRACSRYRCRLTDHRVRRVVGRRRVQEHRWWRSLERREQRASRPGGQGSRDRSSAGRDTLRRDEPRRVQERRRRRELGDRRSHRRRQRPGDRPRNAGHRLRGDDLHWSSEEHGCRRNLGGEQFGAHEHAGAGPGDRLH
jgi:photosystem II stability/assembly factor-like uncharacterized protein